MNYALVEDGVVVNIIYLAPENASDFPNAVPYGELGVGIGDTYENGTFYHNGQAVLSQLQQLIEENAKMAARLAELEANTDEE